MLKTRFLIAIIISLSFASLAGGAYAQDVEPLEINPPGTNANLKDLIIIAYENNPRILAARANWNAAVDKYPQMRSWPDPKLNASWFPEPMETRNGSNDFGFQLMQMIPNPRKLSLKGKKALTMAEMSRVGFEKTVRDVLVDAMKSYYELGYLNRAVEIATTNRDLFKQLSELGYIENTVFSLGNSELYSAEVRLAQAEYELELLMELKEIELSKMNRLLGGDVSFSFNDVRLPVVESNEYVLEDLRELAKEYRQELEMSGLMLDIAEIDLSLAKALAMPDFSLGFMYNSIGLSPMPDDMTTSGDDAYGVMFGITIPIWSGKNRARINEAKSKVEASKGILENQELSTKESVDGIYWKLRNRERLVRLYRDTLVPEAYQTINLAETRYRNNNGNFSQLIETRLIAGNFDLASARAEADYLQGVADLAKITGIPFTENAMGESESETGGVSE